MTDFMQKMMTNPTALAGFAVMSGRDMSDAMTIGATQAAQNQQAQNQQYEYQRKQQLRAQLPQIMEKMKGKSPQEIFNALLPFDPELAAEGARLAIAQQKLGLEEKRLASGLDNPSSVRETEWFMQQPLEVQRAHIMNKRASQILDQGGYRGVYDPMADDITTTFDKTLAPNELPETKEAQARATEQGKFDAKMENEGIPAKERVNSTVDSVMENLNKLDELGGIVSSKNSATENAAISTKQSFVGQAIGKRAGTQEQVLRENIKSQKPALINAIRQATGMSAKAMDSNTELQFYLQQVGGEGVPLESQIYALQLIKEQYGLGGGNTGSMPMQTPLPGGDGSQPIRKKYNPKTGKIE